MASREKPTPRLTAIVMLAATLAGCAAQTAPPPQDPSAAPVSPPPTAQVSKQDKASNDAVSNDTTRGLGWVLVGGGAVAGAVALGTSFLMLYNISVRGSECNDAKICSDKGVEANTQLRTLGGWNLGAWVATAIGLGGGAFLLLTHPKSTESGTTSVGVTPNSSGGLNLGMRSTF